MFVVELLTGHNCKTMRTWIISFLENIFRACSFISTTIFVEYLYVGVYQGSKPQEGSCLWILCLDAGELGAFPLIVKSSWTELFWAAMEHISFSFVSTFQSLMLSLQVRHNGTNISLPSTQVFLQIFVHLERSGAVLREESLLQVPRLETVVCGDFES